MAYSEDVNINLNVLAGAMGGITAIMGGMSALTSSFANIGMEAANNFGAIDALLVTTSAMIASFGVESAKAFGEFEQGMKIVQTVSGQTGSAMSMLSGKANEMSVTYRTAIGDITEGLQTLGRAGLNSVNEQLEVLESGLQTAKLEGRNLNGVLEEIIQNTSMLGGDLKSVDFGEQAEYLNSLMVGTSMTAPITSHDISQTLQYAGGTAAAAGANLENKDKLEDLMGTVAAFAQKGVTGSMAGTALRAFFTKPASQDKSVTEGLERIGLTPEDLWEDGGESMKKVSDQVGTIQRQMDKLNLSTMDQVEIWGKIVGPKMGQQMMKLDSESIKDLTRDIEGAQSAESLALETLQTYTQKLSEMQQQGEMAYRELGRKAVVFLTPIVEVITKILGLISHPVGSFIAFATLGSLLAHGFSKAWSMIKTVYAQFKELISMATEGIANINSLAGGSAPGFQQSASQVDFLNKKLKETNLELQLLQARSMGIKPGYIIPGGTGLDQVDKNMMKVMEENVFIDTKGVYKDQIAGKIYSGDNKEKFITDLKRESKRNQELLDQKELERSEKISKLEKERAEIREQADKDHLNRLEIEERGIRRRISSVQNHMGLAPELQSKLMNDPYYQSLMSKVGLSSNKVHFLDDVAAQGDKHVTDMYRSLLAGYSQYPGADPKKYENLMVEEYMKGVRIDSSKMRESFLSEKLNPISAQLEELKSITDFDDVGMIFSDAEIKKMAEEGVSQLQTGIKVFTEAEFDKWYEGITRQALLEGDPVARYMKERTDEFHKRNPDFDKAGYKTAVVSDKIKDTKPYEDMAYQTKNSGLYDELVETRNRQRKSAINQLGDLNEGSGKRFRDVTTRQIESIRGFGSSIKSAGQRVTDFASQIGTSYRIWERGFGSVQSSLEQRMRGVFDSFNKAEFSNVEEALAHLKNGANLNYQQFRELYLGSSSLRQEIVKLTQEKFKEIEVTDELIREIFAEIDARRNENAKERTGFLQTVFGEKWGEKIGNWGPIQRLGESRFGSFFSKIGGKAASGLGAAGKALSSVTGLMGGPFMAAMMGVTVIMEVIRNSQEEWAKKMQEANNQISEAKDEMSSSEEKIKELYSSENENISDVDLEKALDQQYGNIYDTYNDPTASRSDLGEPTFTSDPDLRGELNKSTNQYQLLTEEEIAERQNSVEEITLAKDENVRALQENTLALAAATQAYAQGISKKAQTFNSSDWGFDSFASDATDLLGGLQESFWNVGAWIEGWWEGAPNQFADKREGFLDSNSPVLTGSQKDEKYEGSTEFAGIYAADIYRFGTEEGLKQFLGSDYDQIVGLLGDINTKVGGIANGRSAFDAHNRNITGMDAETMSIAQVSLKQDKPIWQRLGKQMFRYEQSTGFKGSAFADLAQQSMRGKGAGKTTIKDRSGKIKTLNVRDKNVDNTVKRLMKLTDGKLSYQNVLALGQLQQLQDMYQVASEVVAPGINQTVEGVYKNLMATDLAGQNAGNASDGAAGASSNAAAIAAFLGAKAQDVAMRAAYDEYLNDPGAPNVLNDVEVKDYDSFRRAMAKQGPDTEKYERKVYESLIETGVRLNHPGATQDYIDGRVQDKINKSGIMNSDASFQSKLNTVTKPIMEYAQGATMAAYGASDIGEYGSRAPEGGSGSGGSGDGSGKDKGSDKDTGTKKERVDLVLCNKKEIPKLNVNLFKKPPNFTVLNKNFKLRDIKINSQDKPKAIMNAIKNGIIETQKRMDPKIIQDESAEYNPVEATDGSSTPSGTTRTTT